MDGTQSTGGLKDFMTLISVVGGAILGFAPVYAHLTDQLPFENAVLIQLGLLVMVSVMVHAEVSLD